MTLVLDLPTDLEKELHEGAAARGVAFETYALERLRGTNAQSRRDSIEGILRDSRKTLSPLFLDSNPIAAFLVEKYADSVRENERDFGA